MCGICGIFNFNAAPFAVKSICSMNDAQIHRGPDDEGYLLVNTSEQQIRNVMHASELKASYNAIKPNLFLGHRRLSILDLSEKGHQPMSNDNGTLWITYNGEVYNYIEIREELVSLGYQFHSGTDTEVILKAYEAWGVGCLERFNGMWAFAIWDNQRKRLFCARDNFGIKPFYYFHDATKFIFASEIQAILASGLVSRDILNESVYGFLVFNFLPSFDKTFFKNIKQLEPGHYLIFNNDNSLKMERWWYWSVDKAYTPSKVGERFKTIFEDAVKIRMRSDVPLGSCLSGGLDSSAIVCMMNCLNGNKGTDSLKTFTAVYDENRSCNEHEYSRHVVEHTNAEENLVFPKGEELLADLDNLVRIQGEPFQGLSIYAQYCVMRKIRERGVTVILDGQGGDELFWGYSWYYAFYYRYLLGKLQFRKALKEFLSAKTVRSDISLKRLIGTFFYFSIPAIRYNRNILRAKRYLNPNFFNQKYNTLFDSIHKTYSVGEFQWREIHVQPLPGLLRYEDRNSMAFSVESRLPFLDYRLVSLALSLRPEDFIKDGWTKMPIRDGMAGILPSKIRFRRTKLGFSVPDEDWFVVLKPLFKEVFSGQIKSGDYIYSKKLLKVVDTGKIDPAWAWRFLNVELFLRNITISE
jgi:asparagine synthase (glutamine-hydrolysing)